MNTEIVAATDLTQADLDCWLGFINSNHSLNSPFFSPFFVTKVASLRQHVYVARIFSGANCVGFFPFQRSVGGDAEPVGGGSSDCHGVVSRSDFSYDASSLIHGSGLLSWRYHHLLGKQRAFTSYHTAIRESPTIQLHLGFDHYCLELRRRRGQFLVELERKERKMRREVGEITFVSHVADPSVLSLTLSWKKEQFERTFLPDLETWEKGLLRDIAKTDEPGFRGLLSVLYAGDDIVATHMGIASEHTWHYWYPAYNHKYAKYSPGLLLLFRMIQAAQPLGLARIDLGKTTYRYKRSFMNSAYLLAEGVVVPPMC